MPSFNEKFKKHKIVKTPGGKTKRHILKKTPGKHICAISKKPLQGMPHGKRPFEVLKLTKTQRRPENLLASMISPDVRKDIYLQAVMLKYKIITNEDVDLRYLKYIDMIKNKIE
jgi:ribosomal protein L34E